MDLFNDIPKNTVILKDNLVYPFDLDKYLEEKVKEDRKIYEKTARKLMNRFKHSNEFILKSNNDFHEMSKHAISNFVYALRARGWSVEFHYNSCVNNIGYLGEEIEYYVTFTICPSHKL